MHELSLFGNSDITLGVNIHDYKDLPLDTLNNHIEYHEDLFLKLTNFKLETLLIPDKFNILGKKYQEDKIIPTTAYRIGYNMFQVSKLLNNNKRNVILEIGGGFGLGAYILTNNFNNVCYIILDIPTTALISSYFLLMNNKKVGLINELDEINDEIINKYDIIIVGIDFIKKISPNLIDIVINTASFTEMDNSSIYYYFSNIDRIQPKYIYYDNHELLNFTTVNNALNTHLKNYDLILNQRTPILYQDKIPQWHQFDFNEKIYKLKF